MTDEEILKYEKKRNKIDLRYEIVKLLVNLQQTPKILTYADNLYDWIVQDSNESSKN